MELKSESACSDCLYCGESDSIDHTFLDCQLTSSFTRQVVRWFNVTNNTSFNPEPKEIVFRLFKQGFAGHGAVRKFNFTFFYIMYYIYSRKLKDSWISLSEFVNRINFKSKVEKFTIQFTLFALFDCSLSSRACHVCD